ncbi:MAG: damage-inducible protein DinB [Gammaproteobacteria bacterium]|nr:damage-inducible protein DinB [Gammaproteobacteria bacterium]MDH3467614.1 damage-inducible protein DinB [Gammaproteobacteria bacterium]
MFNLYSHFVAMARNNRWSNYRLYSACRALVEPHYFTQRVAYFGSIHAMLNHILIADLVYLGRPSGEERVSPECDELCFDTPALRSRQLKVEHKVVRFCKNQDASSLASSVSFRRTNGQKYKEAIANVLFHLFVNQVHHRGQVHNMLSQTSVAPPQLNEFFLGGDLPLRQKELAAPELPDK